MPDETITTTHLRRETGAVLYAVLTGTTVHVERHGQEQAVMVPPAEYERLRAAAERAETAA